jgi:acyl carrier protein
MGLDSVELVMAFEESFGIEIADAEAEKLITPRDVCALVMAKYQGRGIPASLESIFDEVRGITVTHLNVRPEDVTLDAHFIEDLGAD